MQNAIAQLDRLEEGIIGLDQLPKRFRKYENEPWFSRGLRIMHVDNYCIFYIPDEQKGIVSIIRVMYGGRDIDDYSAHSMSSFTSIRSCSISGSFISSGTGRIAKWIGNAINI